MKEIRVLSLVPYKILPARLGGEKGIALFSKYLGEQVELLAVSTKNNEIALAENYSMLNILSNTRLRYANIFLYFTLRRLIREQNITHLLLEHPYYAWLGFLLRKTMKIRLVIHSHNIEYMRSRSIGRWWWKALRSYEKWAYSIADLNFFISEDDMNHAISELNVKSKKAIPVTYGIENSRLDDDIASAKNIIQEKHDIKANEKILLFNGALYHHTNYDAVTVITEYINPFLMKQSQQYKIIVCGKGLPESFNELRDFADKNIIYAGFVDDISIYFKAADIFLNPIQAGGGVKTKAIEALSYDCTVISTEIGALGLKREVCGSKLHVVADNDWTSFNEALLQAFKEHSTLPPDFFDYYYWGNIVSKALHAMRRL